MTVSPRDIPRFPAFLRVRRVCASTASSFILDHCNSKAQAFELSPRPGRDEGASIQEYNTPLARHSVQLEWGRG